MRRLWLPLLTSLIWLTAVPPTAAPLVRVKDLTAVQGVRSNPLIGYGLVVGLEGTGDGQQARFTIQSLANLLRRSGVAVPPNAIRVQNVAAVMVTAELPAFARPTQRLNVNVSSIGDADSLRGGTLLMTPLSGPDGQVYAVAQGSISLGGAFTAGGGGGNAVARNHPTSGTIPMGAIVERGAPASLEGLDAFQLLLDSPDFETASRIARAINEHFAESIALPVDASTVRVATDPSSRNPVELLAAIESVPVRPDASARVVVNERTGTVVVGERVRISTVALSHGNLTVEVRQELEPSQPAPFSEGETRVLRQQELYVEEGPNAVIALDEGITVQELVQALNSIGVSARDMVAILQAMHSAGALHAELVVL